MIGSWKMFVGSWKSPGNFFNQKSGNPVLYFVSIWSCSFELQSPLPLQCNCSCICFVDGVIIQMSAILSCRLNGENACLISTYLVSLKPASLCFERYLRQVITFKFVFSSPFALWLCRSPAWELHFSSIASDSSLLSAVNHDVVILHIKFTLCTVISSVVQFLKCRD